MTLAESGQKSGLCFVNDIVVRARGPIGHNVAQQHAERAPGHRRASNLGSAVPNAIG